MLTHDDVVAEKSKGEVQLKQTFSSEQLAQFDPHSLHLIGRRDGF